MRGAVGDQDLRKMSDLLSVGVTRPDGAGGLPHAVLEGIADLVSCDLVSFIDLDVAEATVCLDQEFDGLQVATTAGVRDEDELFWKHYWSTASCSYPSRTGDDRTVTMLSDFCSLREWHATAMYADVFRSDCLEHELMCCLPTKGTRSRRVLLFRESGPDFGERDRMVMALLRPHLAEIHARQESAASATPAASGPVLTPRQKELLGLVAAGRSTAQIAEALYLSPGTVRKHLENIFSRLGVTNRTAAVMRVFAEQ